MGKCNNNCYVCEKNNCEATSDWVPTWKANDFVEFTNFLRLEAARYSGAFVDSDGKLIYIKEVIYNNPATIVFWSDNTKTVTKCASSDVYSPEAGLAIAILKKINTNKNTRKLFDEWLPYEYGKSEAEIKTERTVIRLADVRKHSKIS